MIDFQKLAAPKTAVVPIRQNKFQFQRKKYEVDSVEDGWYKVEMKSNDARVLEKEYNEIEAKTYIWGYTYGNILIFQNFDIGKRKFNKEVQVPLLLNESETFSSIKAMIWEDGLVYYIQPNYADSTILKIKELYDEEKPCNIKGVTNEQKTVYLFHDIERQQYRAALKAEQDQKEKEEFQRSIPGRLSATFKNAGGTLLDFRISGNRIEADWKLDSSNTEFNSVIDLETFKIIEAGYCMSGDDRRHNVTSMVLTAEEYNKRRVVYKTRGKERGLLGGHHHNDDFDDWRDEED